MALMHGGDTVKGGFYWNAAKWDATFVEGDHGVLRGDPGDEFRRVPVALVLLAAPLMGALFVIFLPFVGIALLLQQMGLASFEIVNRLVARVMMAVSPSWQPGMAYLAGRRQKKTAPPAASHDAPLDGLAKDIQERRK